MTRQKIAIIDYGMGNLHSVASALEHVSSHSDIIVTSHYKDIISANRVIFPGVGAIRDCMLEIKKLGIDKIVQELIDVGKPILGICVGMQVLLQSSEENGGVNCLGHFDGHVKFFADDPLFKASNKEQTAQNLPSVQTLKVPHMGWNQVNQAQKHPLWEGIENNERFYFVHSYFVDSGRFEQKVGACHYGRDFTAALAKDNIFAVQFHPEKSHTNGLRLLANFCQWSGSTSPH